MSKKIEKVTGKVEMVVREELDVIGGFTSDLCVDAIQNKKMKSTVLKYRKAIGAEISAQWTRAIAVAEMTVDMRKEFGSDSRLAQFLGMKSRGEFSKLQAAGKLAIEAKKQGIEISKLPALTTVYELLPVENEKHGKQNLLECAKHVAENEMTQAETRDYVKSFIIPEEKPTEELEKPAEELEKQETPAKEPTEEIRWFDVLAIDKDVLDVYEDEYKAKFYENLKTLVSEYFVEDAFYIRH